MITFDVYDSAIHMVNMDYIDGKISAERLEKIVSEAETARDGDDSDYWM